MTDVNVSGMSVAIGMPIYGGIPAGTAMSLFRTVEACCHAGMRLDLITVSAPYVHISRDMVVNEFLAGTCQKLFFIDHDESWQPEDFLRLVALSTRRAVVGASYPAKQDDTVFYINWLEGQAKSEEFGLIKVAGMGLGFCVIDRPVLERLAKRAPKVRNPISGETRAGIFRVDTVQVNGEHYDRGEDIAFFDDVRSIGVDVWLDPGITVGHIGQKEWNARVLDHLTPKQEGKAA